MEAVVSCPHCGEGNVILIDESAGETQEYVEDCRVCCQPWQVRVTLNEDGEPEVDVRKAAG
jgi:cysteine-rich CPXCG protein